MQDGAFLEPQSILAEYDSAGRLTMYSSTQAPHYIQRTLAMALKIPLERVRVIKPAVGGGFGPKASCSTAELVCCKLSILTGKPVKMTFDREQVFLHSRARHQFFHTMTTGVKKDGTLLFLKHHCILDGGAYASFGIATVYYAGSLLGGPYRLKNMDYDGYRVVTNKPACGAQRGHGAVHARALFEIQLDRIADELCLDPLEMRLRNVMETGETTCNELYMSSLGMRECLEAVRDDTGWTEIWKDRADFKSGKGKVKAVERPASTPSENGKVRGIGVACGFFVSGAGYPIYMSQTYHATVLIRISEVGGFVIVESGAADIEVESLSENSVATSSPSSASWAMSSVMSSMVVGIPPALSRTRWAIRLVMLPVTLATRAASLWASPVSTRRRKRFMRASILRVGVPAETMALRSACNASHSGRMKSGIRFIRTSSRSSKP